MKEYDSLLFKRNIGYLAYNDLKKSIGGLAVFLAPVFLRGRRLIHAPFLIRIGVPLFIGFWILPTVVRNLRAEKIKKIYFDSKGIRLTYCNPKSEIVIPWEAIETVTHIWGGEGESAYVKYNELSPITITLKTGYSQQKNGKTITSLRIADAGAYVNAEGYTVEQGFEIYDPNYKQNFKIRIAHAND